MRMNENREELERKWFWPLMSYHGAAIQHKAMCLHRRLQERDSNRVGHVTAVISCTVCKMELTYLLTYLLTYSLTHSLHGAGYYLKADCRSACQKNVLSYGTRRFITVFTQARHWILSWTSWIQFAPSIPISLRSILMLSSYLRLRRPSGIFPSGLPTKTL
jgi:hypothetical protein